MSDKKISISWDELNDPKVEEKLKEREAVTSTQEHYQTAQLPTPGGAATRSRFAFLRSAIVYLTLFGTIGGLVGAMVGLLPRLQADRRDEARLLIDGHERTLLDFAEGRLEALQRDAILKQLARDGRSNPYYQLHRSTDLPADQWAARQAQLLGEDLRRDRIALVIFCVCVGLFIAGFSSAAEPIVDRNAIGAVIAMCMGAGGGAIAGAAGAVGAVLLLGTLDASLRAVAMFALIGLLAGALPGLIARSNRRAIFGAIGGLVGGAIGAGVTQFVPIFSDTMLTMLIPPMLIGLIAGLSAAIVENAAKQGWFKVSEGLIAGKQFILYRNPTFIGSAPLSHIYLFRDTQVGRRHAAVHVIPGGYEIENLPLGGVTMVNGKPVTRQRLRPGDRVQVGRTVFTFFEKQT